MRQRWMCGGRREAIRVATWIVAIWALALAPARAAEDRTLTVGIMTSPAPYYVFSEATGEPIGFALSMWTEVARRAGLEYRLAYFDTLADIEKAVAAKSVDIVPLLVVDRNHAKLFDFTAPVHQSPVSIFTRKNANAISGEAELAGHRVSVVIGHVGQRLMRDYRGELSIAHDSPQEALSSLMTQTSDAAIYQEHIFWQLARQQGIDSLLKTAGPPLRMLPMAIAVRKGQPEVLAALAPALQSYLGSDEMHAAREPWGGNPLPLLPPILIAQVLGALLAAAVIGLGLWRHVSIVRLNTALARSVSEKQSAEARFKDLAEAASDWFFEQDENLRFTFVSSRFEELTGIPASRLIGQKRWDGAGGLGKPHGDVDWQEHIATLNAHKDWRDFAYTVTSQSGEERIITTSGKAIFDAQGRFRGYRGVGRDITNRIALEGALQQAQKMELVGQLTGGIAHDFNNLLTVMVGNLEMLKRNLAGDAKSAVYLSTASEAVDIGTQLVQRLLGFARRQSLNPSPADFNALVSDMLPLVRSSVGGAIDIELDLARDLPPVFADTAQLQNALLNLSINARDAMANGGKLMITTSEIDVSEDFVGQHPGAMPGHFLVLQVRDTGTGIAKEDLAKVVEPFYTTKAIGKGTGLGLSSIYGFARQSEGFLLIDSDVGEGTAVSVYLPVAEVPEAEAAAGAEPDLDKDLQATGQTVLVVEDDPRVRAITVARLQHLGYDVLDAENADEALSTLIKKPAVDLLMTDIVMPGSMSGIDLAARVRTSRPDIKILFAASYSKHADNLHEQERLGPWLQKPYKQAELAQKMREVLDA